MTDFHFIEPAASAEQVAEVKRLYHALPQMYLTEDHRAVFEILLENLLESDALSILCRKNDMIDVATVIQTIVAKIPPPVTEAPTPEEESLPLEIPKGAVDGRKDGGDLKLSLLQAFMSYPFFTLRPQSKNEDEMKPAVKFSFAEGDKTIKIELFPGRHGTASVFDLSVYIYILSRFRTEILKARMKYGNSENVKPVLVDTGINILRGLGCEKPGGKAWKELETSLNRLKETEFTSNVPLDGGMIRNGKDNFITSVHMVRQEKLFHFKKESRTTEVKRLEYVRIEISTWLLETLKREDAKFLTIDPQFNELSSALARRLYLLARKYAGKTDACWSLKTLQARLSDSENRSLRLLRFDIKKLLEKTDGYIAGYKFSLEADNLTMARTGVIRTLTHENPEISSQD